MSAPRRRVRHRTLSERQRRHRIFLAQVQETRDALAVRLKIVGQNLLGPHMEFGDLPSPSNRVGRGVHGEMSLEF